MKARTFFVALLAVLATGCATVPGGEAPPPKENPQLVLPKSADATLDFMAKMAKIEAEQETLRIVSLIKFAEDSGSDFAKGMVASMVSGVTGGGIKSRGTAADLMRTAAEMRRLELTDEASKREHEGRYGFGAQALKWGGLAVDILGLRWNFRRDIRRMDSDDSRYSLTMDALGDSYRSGLRFGTSVFNTYDNRVGDFLERTTP
jgi:hypothetical protein